MDKGFVENSYKQGVYLSRKEYYFLVALRWYNTIGKIPSFRACRGKRNCLQALHEFITEVFVAYFFHFIMRIIPLYLFSRVASVILSTIFLFGCVTPDVKSAKRPNDTATAELSTFSAGAHEKVVLRAGVMFSLLVEVDGSNEIEANDLRVSEDGIAVLPMIGSVALDGLTLSQASSQLSKLYGKFYQARPLVRLQFSQDESSGGSSPWGYVTVLGRVRKPGRVNLPPTRDLTVSGAVQGAGGFDTSANVRAIRITRTGSDHKSKQIEVNMDQIGDRSEARQQDVPLRTGDIVFVPERIF